MTEKKRYTYLNYSRDGHIGSFYLNDKPITNKEVWDLLNEQEERIKELERFKLNIISFAECDENINRRTLNDLIELIDYD